MKIQNTYDRLMDAAAAGVEPDDDDLQAITPPPETDAEAFRRQVDRKARDIAALRRQGDNGEARRLAAEAAEEYRRSFEAHMPRPTTAEPETYETVTQRMFSQ